MASSPRTKVPSSSGEPLEPHSGVLTEAMVIQFLRSKIVERDRSMFELQKRLEESDAALHLQRLQTTELRAALRRRETLPRSGPSHSACDAMDAQSCDAHAPERRCPPPGEPSCAGPHSCLTTLSKWKAWKHTSKVVVEALLERLALESEASEALSNIQEWARRDAMRMAVLHNALLASLQDQASGKSRSAMFDALRDMEMQKANLAEQLIRSERTVASSTAQCKRLQTESAELRLRSEILTHRVEQLQQVSAASMRASAELTSARQELEQQRQSLDRALTELRLLQRVHGELQDEHAQHKATSARRYDELLRARDGLSRELSAVRMELAACMESKHRGCRAAQPCSTTDNAANMGALSPPQLIASGPLRLSRVTSAAAGVIRENRNPYLSGMISPPSHR